MLGVLVLLDEMHGLPMLPSLCKQLNVGVGVTESEIVGDSEHWSRITQLIEEVAERVSEMVAVSEIDALLLTVIVALSVMEADPLGVTEIVADSETVPVIEIVREGEGVSLREADVVIEADSVRVGVTLMEAVSDTVLLREIDALGVIDPVSDTLALALDEADSEIVGEPVILTEAVSEIVWVSEILALGVLVPLGLFVLDLVADGDFVINCPGSPDGLADLLRDKVKVPIVLREALGVLAACTVSFLEVANKAKEAIATHTSRGACSFLMINKLVFNCGFLLLLY